MNTALVVEIPITKIYIGFDGDKIVVQGFRKTINVIENGKQREIPDDIQLEIINDIAKMVGTRLANSVRNELITDWEVIG